MPIIIPANSAASGGYEVANSLRFNTASSDYLTRAASAFGTSTNKKKCTISFWIKRSTIAVQQAVMGVETTPAGGANEARIVLKSDDTLEFYDYQSGYKFRYITTRTFRDPSAWYHVVLAVDTTHPTGSARVNIYINGVQETSFSTSTDPAQNLDTFLNSGNYVQIGRQSTGNSYLGSYLTEYAFIDGSTLAQTDFGEFDEDSAIWKPKAVSGLAFGTNGFYLDFEDSSALGNDAAGSNNFSLNNLTALDQSTDTCTNNFATMNALAKSLSNVVLSNGNLICRNDDGANGNVLGTIALVNGKYYWETYKYGGGNTGLGVTLASVDGSNHTAIHASRVQYYQDGYIYQNGFGLSDINTGVTYGDTDIIGVSVDSVNGTIKFYKNGSLVNNSSQTNSAFTYAQNELIPFWFFSNGGEWRTNFGSPPFAISSGNADANDFGNFEYAVPSGYFALCTKNVSEANS